MIHPKIRPQVKELIESEYIFPDDIIDEIRRNETAWNNYQSFTESYKRIRVAYIDAARDRPDEFKKRLSNFISKTERNRIISGTGSSADSAAWTNTTGSIDRILRSPYIRRMQSDG